MTKVEVEWLTTESNKLEEESCSRSRGPKSEKQEPWLQGVKQGKTLQKTPGVIKGGKRKA